MINMEKEMAKVFASFCDKVWKREEANARGDKPSGGGVGDDASLNDGGSSGPIERGGYYEWKQ